MVDGKEPASLAAESVLQREAGAASVTLGGVVGGVPSISDGDVVKPLVLGEFCAGESVCYGREPRASSCGSFHPFFDFLRQPCHEGCVEGSFAVTLNFLVTCASGTNTVPVCFDVDGFVVDEGAS